MNGLLQNVLTKRYGTPEIVTSGDQVELRWLAQDNARRSILYAEMIWDSQNEARFGIYRNLYGDTFGGFLVGSSLKVATIGDLQVFGLYQLQELQDQPEVRDATALDPDIHFFMDAANVWFYGIKGEDLYVYDGENAELDLLGPVAVQLEVILAEWEEASQ